MPLHPFYHKKPTPHVKFKGHQTYYHLITPESASDVASRITQDPMLLQYLLPGQGARGEIVIDVDGRVWFVNLSMELYRLTTFANHDVKLTPPTRSNRVYHLFSNDDYLRYTNSKRDKAGGWANRRVIGVGVGGEVPEWYTAMKLEMEWGDSGGG